MRKKKEQIVTKMFLSSLNQIHKYLKKNFVYSGDGLKKLRKSNKERRLMMKYLPGDKKLREAKIDIAKEWKIDFQKAFGTTHKKLEKLAGDKTKEGMYFSKFQVKVQSII